MPAPVRGCGTRQEAGIYLVTKLAAGGRPIEDFLLCPPILLAPTLGVTPIGVTLMEVGGVTHVVDWIGSRHYPNVADWIEETRRFGMSRRVPATLDFSRLTRESRWIGVHARAHIVNPERYWAAVDADQPRVCRRRIAAHNVPTYQQMCVSLYWEDVEGGTPIPEKGRLVERTLPSFRYLAHRAPEYTEPLYRPAMFISLPLSGIEVIRAKGGRHEQNAAKASASTLPVTIEEE